MALALTFSLTLFVGVMLSGVAHRSVLSTALLFLVAGFVAGPAGLSLMRVDADAPSLGGFVTFVLFAVLFTDGMRADAQELVGAWRLPGRALIVGLPLTLMAIALLGRLVLGLSWLQTALVAAALAPTDPVFARAILGREGVPLRLRRLLNVESGLNDGIALPVVVVMIALAGHHPVDGWALIAEVLGGIALGGAVPWIALRFLSPTLLPGELYRPLGVLAIGLMVFSASSILGANPYLAGFAAGVTVVSMRPEARGAFDRFGELLTELLKLAAILVFGALISPAVVADSGWSVLLFAVLVLLVARPLALGAALLRSTLDRRERIVAGWFGPKGFASVAYALLILREVPGGAALFSVIATVIAVSIVLHSSSDVPIARWFVRSDHEH